MLARFHGVAASAEQLAHQQAKSGGLFTLEDIVLSARRLGLMAKSVKTTLKRLSHCPLPAILQDNMGRFFILAAKEDKGLLIHDVAFGKQQLSLEALDKRWNGRVILIRTQATLAADLARFDFTWFIPAIVKYRKLLG